MTEEQIEKIRQASIKNCKNRKEVYCKNINTGEIIHTESIADMAKLLNVAHSGITKCLKGTQKVVSHLDNIYVFSDSENFIEVNQIKNIGRFKNKYSLEEFAEKVLNIQKEGYKTMAEISKIFGICKKTVSNYSDKLKEQGIFLFKTK